MDPTWSLAESDKLLAELEVLQSLIVTPSGGSDHQPAPAAQVPIIKKEPVAAAAPRPAPVVAKPAAPPWQAAQPPRAVPSALGKPLETKRFSGTMNKAHVAAASTLQAIARHRARCKEEPGAKLIPTPPATHGSSEVALNV